MVLLTLVILHKYAFMVITFIVIVILLCYYNYFQFSDDKKIIDLEFQDINVLNKNNI